MQKLKQKVKYQEVKSKENQFPSLNQKVFDYKANI